MGRVRTLDRPPEGSIITRNMAGGIDYLDAFAIEIENRNDYSIDHLTSLLFTSLPSWGRALLKFRDVLVKPLGLRTGLIPEQEKLDPHVKYTPGDRAIFFRMIDRTDSEIVMAEDDTHLYFRVSLAALPKGGTTQCVRLTTLVQFHNTLGRFYFAVVKPFHRLLVRRLLANFARKFLNIGQSPLS